MKSKPHFDTLLEVWNKLPNSEKKNYSVLSLLNESRNPKENNDPRDLVPPKDFKRSQTHSLDLLRSVTFDEPVNSVDIFGVMSEVDIQSLPVSLDHPNRLFISDIQAANDLGLLRKNQIYSILSLGKGNKPFTYPSIKGGYRCVPLEDNEKTDILQQMPNIYSFIDMQLQNGNVLVHCMRGKSRSCAVVIAYLMKKYYLSYEEAEGIVRNARPCCEVNGHFVKQLNSLRWKNSYC